MPPKDLSSVCRILRERRKAKNISLEKASHHTKLSPAILRRIEAEDRLDDMNQVYLKGFIKIYAAFLGEEEIVKSLDEIFYLSQNQPQTEKKPFSRGFSLSRKLYLAGLSLLFVLLLGAAAFLLHRVFSSYRRHQAKTKAVKAKALPAAKPAKASSSLPSVAKKQTNSIYRLILALRAKKDVFLEVRVDGELVFRDTISAGAKDSWQGKNKIKLWVNNPSFLEMEFNGEDITPSRKRPATYIFTPRGFKVSP